MLAEVALQYDDARLRGTHGVLCPQHGHRAIAAAIVDEHAFVGNIKRVQRGIEPREERRQRGLLIEHGDNDA